METLIQPHDQTVVHRTIELKVQTKFDKESGGLMMVKTEVLKKEEEEIHAAVMGYMLISGLYVWCQLVDEKKDGTQTKSQADQILIHLAEMLKIIQFVNPQEEVKKMLNQLDVHKEIDQMLGIKPNDNPDNTQNLDQQK